MYREIMNMRALMVPITIIVALAFTSCSVVMASKRSTHKDTGVIQIGVDRDVIISTIGHPDTSIRLENGGQKDIYRIDPEAHKKGSKYAAVAGHFVADVVTLGLWEILGTPLELAAQDEFMTFILKYGADGKLAELETIK